MKSCPVVPFKSPAAQYNHAACMPVAIQIPRVNSAWSSFWPAIFPKMTPVPVSLLPPGYLSNYKPTFISSDNMSPGSSTGHLTLDLTFLPSNDVTWRSGDHEGQQEPRGADASTILHSAKTPNETLAHIMTYKHTQCSLSVHEKSITGKSTGSQASEIGGSVRTKKANGSAIHDKGKMAEGETAVAREKMKTPLNESCGHLGCLKHPVVRSSYILGLVHACL